jgi:hypothetical protein
MKSNETGTELLTTAVEGNISKYLSKHRQFSARRFDE